ncbi:MAG: FGGY family carbohydrate kinase, partial [Nitrospirota bacterium]
MLFIGVDVGTQGVRVIVSDDKGNIYSHVSQPFYRNENLPPGWSEQDANVWWQNLILCLQETVQNLSLQHCPLEDIKAFGVTSTSGTVVALNEAYQPLHPAIMYND